MVWLVGQVARLLGEVLGREPAELDLRQTFRVLGVDLVSVAEFVALVNAAYGCDLQVGEVLDHPTPVAFARYLAVHLGWPVPSVPSVPYRPALSATVPVPAVSPAVRGVPAGPAPVVPGGSGGFGGPGVGGLGSEEVLVVVRDLLAGVLCCDVWELDPQAVFGELGVDPVVGAEFIAVVNQRFGLRESGGVLFECPTLGAFAVHVARLVAGRTAGVSAAR